MKKLFIVLYYVLQQMFPRHPRELLDIPLTGDPNFEPRYFVASNAVHK